MSATRDELPAISRLGRTTRRPARMLGRASRYGARDRNPRRRRQIPIGELVAFLIDRHGLTAEVRQRAVGLYWTEIVGERVAAKSTPESTIDGVLQVSVASSPWVQELQMKKPGLIAQINTWVEGHREWLGPPPLVTDIRFSLAKPRRDRLVDPAHASQLRQGRLRRTRRVPDVVPPVASTAEREAIRAETCIVADDELRDVIEAIRLKWNR